jgi:hypothetical protein
VPEELTSRVDEVRGQDTHIGKAKVVTGFAVKHVVAQVATTTLTEELGEPLKRKREGG